MTIDELRQKLYEVNYPLKFEVDAITYARACQAVINHTVVTQTILPRMGNIFWLNISVGPHNGLYFKNVELILKETK